jgi:hypothetical protein
MKGWQLKVSQKELHRMHIVRLTLEGRQSVGKETVQSISYLEKVGFLKTAEVIDEANYDFPLGLHPFSTARSKIR